MTEHNEIQLYAVRAEVDRLKSELIRIQVERNAAVDAGIQLCVHGQPHDDKIEEWRAAARVISGMHAK